MIEKRSGIPLVGWEFKNHNANAIREDIYQKNGIINQKKVTRYNTMSNTGKVLGVIPVVGAVVGVARIITTVTDDKQLYGNSYWKKAGFIVRGATEIIGLGILWGIADAASFLFNDKSSRRPVVENEYGQEDDELEDNEPLINNANPPAVTEARVEVSGLSVKNRDALKSAICNPFNVSSDLKADLYKEILYVPFNKLPISGVNIYLGNDYLRQVLVERPEASLDEVNNAFEKRRQDYLENDVPVPPHEPLGSLPDVIVSLNSIDGRRRADDGAALDRIETPEITHIRYPITKGTKQEYEEGLRSEALQRLFEEMDGAINEGKSVYIHCEKGDHFSATILTLYLHSRTGVSFEMAYRFVFCARPAIKPFIKEDGRDTLMTVAKELTDRGEL